MSKKVSYVYPNTSDLNRGGRGGLSARFELAQSAGCKFIEMPADFIKNKTEIQLTGLDLGSTLTKEGVATLYEPGSPSRDLAYILHTYGTLPSSNRRLWGCSPGSPSVAHAGVDIGIYRNAALYRPPPLTSSGLD